MKNLKLKIFLFIIISIISETLNQTNSTYCSINLECLDTGCCHHNECSSSSKCKKVNKICYGLVGAAGIIFIGISFIVFFFKIKKIRNSVLALKEIDDKFYLKRRNSNADNFRNLRNKQSTNSIK